MLYENIAINYNLMVFLLFTKNNIYFLTILYEKRLSEKKDEILLVCLNLLPSKTSKVKIFFIIHLNSKS